MEINLQNQKFKFLKGYQNQPEFRAAFNRLVTKVFCFCFEAWYQAGYWNEKYIPYTLFAEDKAVANVSVNIMDFVTFGEQRRYIQIGTVMTDEAYRGKKLSRFLMEAVQEEWTDKCDFIYLFANQSVLEMYPKFGFSKVTEYQHYKNINMNPQKSQIENLDMSQQSNRVKLYTYAKNTAVFGKLSMHENADLVMFYCTSILKENIYYIPDLEVIAVATYNNQQLLLWDLFAKEKVALDDVIDSLANSQTSEVTLGFTPEDCSSYKTKQYTSDDVLFIQSNNSALFRENELMFPLLSHA